MTPGERWGSALKTAMRSRRIPSRNLAESLGCHTSRISEYRIGKRLPRMETAAQFAEALATPYLLELCGQLRTRACEECGRDYIADQRGGTTQRWCDKTCSARGRWRIRTADDAKRSERSLLSEVNLRQVWERRARKYADAVGAMCRACEPEGACRQPDCELRSVSPLPLIEMIPTPIARSGVVRLGPSPAATKHRRDYGREWARRKRA